MVGDEVMTKHNEQREMIALYINAGMACRWYNVFNIKQDVSGKSVVTG